MRLWGENQWLPGDCSEFMYSDYWVGVFFVCFFTQLLERVISSPSTLDCKVIAQVAWCEATCLQTIMV